MTYKINSKIVLGTAQFGKPYGFNNTKKKKVSSLMIKKILKYCRSKDIFHLDTAFDYDFNLKLLGDKQWEIDTKIIIKDDKNFLEKISEKINSIVNIKTVSIKTVYIHNPERIFSSNGHLLINFLQKIKKLNIIKSIGISVYDVASMKKIMKKINVDVIQLPYNILDRRFEKFFKMIKSKKIKIYVRSVFLQGVLTSSVKNKITKSREIKKFNFFSSKNEISNINLCLSFVKKNKLVNKIILGVDNLGQLKQIMKISNYRYFNFESLKSDNLNIIDPRRW